MKSNNKLKIFLIAAIFVLAAAGAVFAFYMSGVAAYQNKVKNTVISGVNISQIPDGVYIGEYDVSYIYAKVEVTVKSGEITGISILEHRNDRGESAERIIDEIIERQEIDVDAVSGATNSSTVIKKAVENAVNQGSPLRYLSRYTR